MQRLILARGVGSKFQLDSRFHFGSRFLLGSRFHLGLEFLLYARSRLPHGHEISRKEKFKDCGDNTCEKNTTFNKIFLSSMQNYIIKPKPRCFDSSIPHHTV